MTSPHFSPFHPASLVATFFGVGKIPFAPGTWGSIAAFPLLYGIGAFVNNLSIISGNYELYSRLITFFSIILSIIVILFVIGCISSHIYVKHTGKEDPGEIVIDEVVGQSFTFILILPSLLMGTDHVTLFIAAILGAFALFRFFDILKPWPINWCDTNIKGGLGIMVDDMVAGLMAAIIYYALLFVTFDALKWVHH